MDRMIEHVNGIIIGDITILATVHTPNGRQYGNSEQFDTSEQARAWAETIRKNAMQNAGRDESRRLGWDKPWELRIHE